MRTLRRNKIKVWYVLYQGETEITDSLGNYTGEWEKTYSEPILLMANVAPATGATSIEAFGVDSDYTHVMVVEGTDCPLDEESQVWIGDDPTNATDGFFKIVRVAKSLNHIRYALKEVQSTWPTLQPST